MRYSESTPDFPPLGGAGVNRGTPALQVLRVTRISKAGGPFVTVAGQQRIHTQGSRACAQEWQCTVCPAGVSLHQLALLLRRLQVQVANSAESFPDRAPMGLSNKFKCSEHKASERSGAEPPWHLCSAVLPLISYLCCQQCVCSWKCSIYSLKVSPISSWDQEGLDSLPKRPGRFARGWSTCQSICLG